MGKSRMVGRLIVISGLVLAAGAFAASSETKLEPANIDLGNKESLQRGAGNFMNYCSGCHSAQYVRYNTIGKHLDLSEEQLIDNLMFNAERTFETIKASMPAADAARWYGVAPPDMSLIARSKGADHIYNFLKSFYVDPESPTGVNNTVLSGASMPHVLWELQGYQVAKFEEHTEDGVTTQVFQGFEPLTEGKLSAEDYDKFVRDTVNFLSYIAEPVRDQRRTLGTWVMIYLVIFLIVARMLKKQVWKDVK